MASTRDSRTSLETYAGVACSTVRLVLLLGDFGFGTGSGEAVRLDDLRLNSLDDYR